MANTLPALYRRASVMLWVEDPLTRDYLDTLWQTTRIGFLVGGGHGSVGAATEDAYRSGIAHVFGVRDRDFGKSNRERWGALSGQERVYRLPRVEIENYMLDPVALAACRWNTERRSATEIEGEMKRAVADSAWWLATRRVLYALNRDKNRGFPPDPKVSEVASRADAGAWIVESVWSKTTAAGMGSLVTSAAVEARLGAAHAGIVESLKSEAWRAECSGKEVFTRVDAYIWARGRLPSPRAELARAVGEQQVALGRVPLDLVELKRALTARVMRGTGALGSG